LIAGNQDFRLTVIFITSPPSSNKKPTVLERNLSASRVFPVDDSAKVESSTVCLQRYALNAIKIMPGCDLNHIEAFSNLYSGAMPLIKQRFPDPIAVCLPPILGGCDTFGQPSGATVR